MGTWSDNIGDLLKYCPALFGLPSLTYPMIRGLHFLDCRVLLLALPLFLILIAITWHAVLHRCWFNGLLLRITLVLSFRHPYLRIVELFFYHLCVSTFIVLLYTNFEISFCQAYLDPVFTSQPIPVTTVQLTGNVAGTRTTRHTSTRETREGTGRLWEFSRKTNITQECNYNLSARLLSRVLAQSWYSPYT